MAALNEILDDQSAYHAQDALDQLYQAGALSNVDLSTFRQSFRNALAQQGALDDNQIGTVVDAVSNEIESNGANPVDFVTPAQKGPPRYPHEESGLYYDEAGNWYNSDGTASAYTWNAEQGMFYDASGNWYNANLSPYAPPQASEAPPRYLHEESGLYYDEAGNWYNADLTPYAPPQTSEKPQQGGAEEAISGLIDDVLKKLPEAAGLPPEELAELLAKTLEQL